MADVKFYWRLVLKRLPLLLAIIILSSALGVVQAIRLPATYTTEARLLVESAVVEGSVNASSSDEEIQIIREQLMTRANLLEIAYDFDVLEDYSSLLPGQIVGLMRGSTRIVNQGGLNQATLITVSFSARSGQIAADVVNEYVTRIVSTSVDRRLEQAQANLAFHEQEETRLSDELGTRSAAISRFQAENADALPDDQAFRLNRQADLQERISSAQRELSALIDQRARIIEIYEETGRLSDGDNLTDDERQLRDLERELAMQLTIYSESAPQIIVLRRRIEQLRDSISGTDSDTTVNPGQAVLDLQLDQIDAQTNDLESVIADAREELLRLEDAIERTPLNGVILEGMQRDYENTRALYDRAADNLQQARIDLRIQETNRGQRITLIENANVPRFPSSPNRKLIALIGGVIGVVIAGGVFALMEILNRAIRRPMDINRALGIEPIATIPYIETSQEQFRRIGLRVAALILVIIGLPATFWAIDTYYLPLDELANTLLDRFGLA